MTIGSDLDTALANEASARSGGDTALSLAVTKLTADLAALTARVTALEVGTVPPQPQPPVGTPVPASIDATGGSDVTAALTSFLLSLPAGSTAVFKAGGVYAVASAIKLGGRVNLTLEGQGATIRAMGSGFNENFSLLYFQTFPGTNAGVKVRNLKLQGNSPTPGIFISGKEGQHGILIDGGTNFEVTGCAFSNTYGDGIEVNSGANGVHAHGNTYVNIGRNAVSVITGSNVEVDHETIGKVGYCVFDVEPNTAFQPSSKVAFHDNAATTWGNAFFAVDGSLTGAVLSDISVVNNTCAKNLLTVVTGPGRKTRVTFTGNKGTGGSGTVTFLHVDGLVVTGNTGVTVGITDCPNAVTSPNP